LKIQKTLNDQHQAEIIVELEQDLMERHKRRAARKIAQQTKIPGFRPGKAPYAVVIRHFGEEAIIEEALESVINEVYPEIIKEAEIDPYTSGNLTDVESKEPPKFKLMIPLMPEVVLPDYRSVRKDYSLEPATDKEVDQILMNIQTQQAVTEPVEDRPIENGDMVQLTMTQTIKDPDEGQEPVIATDMPQTIYVDPKFDTDETLPFKGFMKKLVGLNIGDEKKTTHTFNEIDESDPLYGKKVEFQFKVEAISKADLPELNDDFAQTVNPELETLEELKADVKQQVENYRKQQYENDYLTDVMEEIVEGATVKYPTELFEAEAHAYMHQLQDQATRQGMEWEAYLKANNQTEESLIEEQKPELEKRIKRILVLEEIARKEELRVENEELQAQVFQTMVQGGLMNYLKSLPKKQADEISQRITMDSANQILNDKLMRRLIDIASGEIEKKEAALKNVTDLEKLEAAAGDGDEENEESETEE
jgi:trigger factor